MTAPAAQAEALKGFLLAVVTTPQGYMELGVRNGSWQQHWYEWPTKIDDIVGLALESEGDVYFSAHLFGSKDSHKENVLPSRTIQADLDNADVGALALTPSALVGTSPDRHQGYWVAATDFDSLQAQELVSKKLTYSIPLCDRSGWSLGHKVRLPYTKNYKYKSGPYPVELVRITNKLYAVDELELLPEPAIVANQVPNGEFIESPPGPIKASPYDIVEKVKDHLSAKVYSEYLQDAPSSDRSASLFALTTQLFRAGLSREEVYWVARQSPNNKFHQDLRYNADRELAKDVLRAEIAVKSLAIDFRALINEIRKKTKTLISERKYAIAEIVKAAMSKEGEFIHLTDGRRYYVPRDTARPIEIEMLSEPLHSILDVKYSLNRTEVEHTYTTSHLVSYSGTLPETAQAAVLSYYDQASKLVLVHTGRKDVLAITKQGQSTVSNGTYNVIFPWDRIIEPFTPSYDPSIDWAAELFDLPNVINMTPEEARCVLKIWVLFSLLRDAATSRPILAFFGQPGCLSGDTEVKIRVGTFFKTYTLEELYKKYNDIPMAGQGNWRKWNREAPTEVLSLQNDSIQYRPLTSVTYSGEKQTYLLLTEDKEYIRATAEHPILTPSGYIPLCQLKPGDTIYMRGTASTSKGKRDQTGKARRRVSARYHPYGSKEVVAGKLYPRIYYSRAVVEADLNGLPLAVYLYVVQNVPAAIDKLKFLDREVDVHHKDGDITNNVLDNLEVLSHSGHAKEHGVVDNAENRFGYFSPREAIVKGVVPYKVEPTYDIAMEGEPNFLANDFVVHNSGKTSTARKLYAFFYGRHMDVSGATSPVHYDMATANLPFYVLDNLDTWEKWIPDRLAQSAGKSDVIVRKLYTNNQIIRIKRQAMVAVTAHDPKFGRADVTDRMLIVSLQRFSNVGIQFQDEGALISRVVELRNKLWGGVLHDLQLVLSTPLPPVSSLQLRIQDFARLGEWIAIALGEDKLFAQAVGSLQAAQRSFNLDEDHILVSALQRWIAKTGGAPNGKTQDQIYSEVLSIVPNEDIKTFQLLYKNSGTFCKRISNLQDTLNSTMFHVEIDSDKVGQRIWRIT